jgi:hypothetical protein
MRARSTCLRGRLPSAAIAANCSPPRCSMPRIPVVPRPRSPHAMAQYHISRRVHRLPSDEALCSRSTMSRLASRTRLAPAEMRRSTARSAPDRGAAASPAHQANFSGANLNIGSRRSVSVALPSWYPAAIISIRNRMISAKR